MAEAYRFGAVEIRPVERQVAVEGRPAAIGSRAFDVLLALVEHRDRVVTKNELLELAWPGLVVEENNLQAQVSALRRVLGPQAIATIPGRGYRFAMTESGSEKDSSPVEPRAVEKAAQDASARTLPRLSAPLLGRSDELAALGRLLEQHRIVTVAGAAGIGKTSVAIAAAEERRGKLRDGAAWVELGPISDPALVPAAVAQALQVKASAGTDVGAALAAALRNLEMLLVLDNAEQVLDAVARWVDATLAQAPGVAVLVTSRSALKLKDERLFRLGPLGIPDADVPLDEARTFGAVALLAARAQAVDPRFSLTEENIGLAIQICRDLDGIALAIELAAARLPLLGMKGLADRIGERFRLLTAGTRNAPTRQQTMLAALDWSYELLSGAEQKVFRRLGVFSGDFSLAAATAVAQDASTDEWAAIDALGALVDRSLVEVEGASTPRYRLLESTRAYARLKLRENADEQAAAERAHAQAMLSFFASAEDQSWIVEEKEWVAAYGPELDNLRAALDWSERNDPAIGIALLGQGRFLFALRGLEYELRERCERLEPASGTALPPAVAADYWRARGDCTRFVQRDLALAMSLKSAELYREIGDARGRYLAWSDATLNAGAGEGNRLIREMAALERPEWPARVRLWGLRAYAYVAVRDGRTADAGMYLERSVELATVCGSENMVSRSLSNLADHKLSVGDMRKAIEIGRELLKRTNARTLYNLLVVRGNLANALLQAGEIAQAREMIAHLHEESRTASWDTFPTFAPVYALLAACEGRVRSAARLIGYAEACDRSMGGQIEPNELRARDLAMQRVSAALDAAECRALIAEGERLREDEVCALTLERPEKARPAREPAPAAAGSRRTD